MFTTGVNNAIRVVVGWYRLLPISSKVRDRISGAAGHLAPRLYQRIVAPAGAPAIRRRREAGPLWVEAPEDGRHSRISLWRISHKLRDHAVRNGRITHLIVLPFLARGGAELTALNFCRAAIENGGGSVLLVAADKALPGVSSFVVEPGVLTISLSELVPDADLAEREAMLVGLFQIASPDVFHVINSGVGWNVIAKSPERFRPVAKVFASVFAFQFDEKTGRKLGYAAAFLKDTMPNLDGLLSDNQRLVRDAIVEYDLANAAERIHVIYNPTRTAPSPAGVAGLSGRISAAKRLQVLWAGRLDREKRIDLISKIAELCPDMDFHVHGARVVDELESSADLELPNVRLYGEFKDPAQVLRQHETHAFIFTSRWEGLPNVLVEFGALGIPIVAACVGGVGELIDDSTGYPLGEHASAADYARALREIISHPADAQSRAEALIALISERHSYAAFLRSVSTVRGYLSSGPNPSE